MFDVITFPSKSLSFFYEATEKVLYRISSSERVSALMGSENNNVPSQTLRRDRLEKNLYFFYKKDKFSVLVGVHDEGYKNMLQFGGFDASKVADFIAIGEDKFIIMEKSGTLSLFHFSAKFIKKLFSINLNHKSDDLLEYTSLAVDEFDRFLVVSVASSLSQEKKKLLLLEIDASDFSISVKDEKEFSNEPSNSVFLKLSVDTIGDNKTIVSCFEKGHNFNLVCYAIQSGKFEYVTTIPQYHSAPFLTHTKIDGQILSLDIKGNLYFLPIKNNVEMA